MDGQNAARVCPSEVIPHDTKLLVGLTGGIAAGKTAVAELLRAHGAVIVDADVLAREVVEPGTPGLAAIVKRFGTDVLNEDGSLNRTALGAVVFADEAARADLNAIVHPLVRSLGAERIAAAPSGSLVVSVIPLLVETGQVDSFDVVVLVDCDEDVQLARLQSRNGLSLDDARARVAAQATRAQRRAAADIVFDNSGPAEELAPRVAKLWETLTNLR